MALSDFSWLSNPVVAASGRLHWFAAGIGLFASTLCGAVILSQPPGTILHPLAADNGGTTVGPLFGANFDLQDRPQEGIRLLAGINGEISASHPALAAEDEILSESGQAELAVAPVALDGLSQSSCLTVTTKRGETFSFRILGVHAQAGPETGKAAPKIELAIAGCANNGEPVAKAVIESDAPRAVKTTAPERSL